MPCFMQIVLIQQTLVQRHAKPLEWKIELYKLEHTKVGKSTDSDSGAFSINELIDPLQWVYFFGIEGHVALDTNTGLGYNTLLLRLITGDVYSALPHIQFQTLTDILDSRAALSNSNPDNACQRGWQFVPFL